MKYSGMAFQMFVIFGIAIFIGQKLDKYLQLAEPLITIGLSLFALIGYLSKLYVDVTKGEL